MAWSSVDVTAGSGTPVATQPIGGKEVQVMVLADPTTDGNGAAVTSAEPTPGSTLGVAVYPAARAYTIYRNLDLDETGINVKNAAGRLHGIVVNNLHATTLRYLKLYNKATAPSVGTDVPVMTIPVKALSDSIIMEFYGGIAFSAGIGVGATTGLADADTGAPGANEIVCHLFYK